MDGNTKIRFNIYVYTQLSLGHFSSDIVETKHVEPRVQNKGVEPVNKREKSLVETKHLEHVEPRVQNKGGESVVETKGENH